MGAGKGRSKRASSVSIGRRGRGVSTRDLSPEAIAKQAVRVGLQTYAKNVFATWSDDRTVSANEHGVVVTQQPHDLPFMEHPAYNAVPQTLLDGSVNDFREDVERQDIFAAAREFMAQSGATLLVIDLVDEQELRATKGDITLFGQQERRFFPGSRTVELRRETTR